MRHLLARASALVERPVDPAGLAAFRILFGALVMFGAARFLWSGTLEKIYCDDAFAFRYWGASFVPVPDVATIRILYVGFIALGALIAIGLCTRLAAAAFTTTFAWVQLIDVTNYLNHYYLVVLLGALLVVLPSNAALSLDAALFSARRDTVPFGAYLLLRFQVACVYVFAAVAKVGSDWLVHGQPLGMWLPAKDELVLIGPLLSVPFVPLVLSWGGLLYDATIVGWLSWRRTRAAAYVVVLVFHGLTSAFFAIGMFPVIMAVATTAFFDPTWPRLRAAPAKVRYAPSRRPLSRVVLVVALLWCAFHVVFPLRCFALGDDVLWDETGMRFSWRVMVREKSGTLEYRVTLPDTGREVRVSPHDLLTWRQANEMIGQPDLILQLAHHIRDDFRARGFGDVAVRADARVSLNGRRIAPFIDPDVDLATVEDGMDAPLWVLPAPTTPPPSPWR
jgi:vitamin K-dependent gamma-carboxylase